MEGSKAFAKGVMERANVPTAAWKSFTDQASCEAYVRHIGAPVVVKADGLAAGKGVIVATELEQALEASASVSRVTLAMQEQPLLSRSSLRGQSARCLR